MKTRLALTIGVFICLQAFAAETAWQRMETGTAEDVAGTFVYDPIAKTSVKNVFLP